MIDINVFRTEPERIVKAVRDRGMEFDAQAVVELDQRRRDLLYQVEQKKAVRNTTSEEIGQLRREGQDASAKIAAMRKLSDEIKQADDEIRELEARLDALMLEVPNIPRAEVPVGASEEENVVVRSWGEPKRFDFQPLAHWDLGMRLDILDWARGAKVAGARFVVNKGAGATLERALINLMLDTHIQKHGYTEIFAPYLACEASAIGTGNLPKFADNMFKTTQEELYLIPTAEVPLTNLHRDEILEADQLPIRYVGYTACFRRELVSAGQESRGLIRQWQFHKVELMKYAKPEESTDELMRLIADAEEIVQMLGLHYRVVQLCTADITFSSAMTFDIEVYFPGMARYAELSSCSVYDEFQARRTNTRYRPAAGARPKFVHTMNGSGLATGRTVGAILENYQQADGCVVVPDVLRPYMRGVEVIGLP